MIDKHEAMMLINAEAIPASFINFKTESKQEYQKMIGTINYNNESIRSFSYYSQNTTPAESSIRIDLLDKLKRRVLQ